MQSRPKGRGFKPNSLMKQILGAIYQVRGNAPRGSTPVYKGSFKFYTLFIIVILVTTVTFPLL